MLVLNRKIGEVIIIDGGILVRVLEVQGGGVRIGIDAPIQLKIERRSAPVPVVNRSLTNSCKLRFGEHR